MSNAPNQAEGQQLLCGEVRGLDDIPQTVHNINSIVASFSRTRFKLIAMADCPIIIVPM
jgi:hypothetical protein